MAVVIVMEYIDALLIMHMLRSICSYFFLYKIMELKTYHKSRIETYLFLFFLIIVFIGNLAIFAFISWEDKFGIVRYYPDIIEDILMMLVIIAVFHTNIWKSIYYSVFGYMFVMSVQLLGSIIDFIIFQYIFHIILTTDQEAILYILEIGMLFIFYMIIGHKNKIQYEIDEKDWPLFAVLAIIVCAYFYYIQNVVPYIDPENSIMYVSMDYIQLGFMVGIFFLFDRYHIILGKKSQKLLNTQLKLQSEEFQLKLRDELTHANTENKKLRHDLKHHFTVLQSKIKEDPEYALEYVKQLSDHVEIVTYANTNNEILNYILNTKAAIAHQMDIPFEYKISDALLFINDFDLISILGNALDNAIEALQFVKEAWIHMEIASYEDTVIIKIENPCDSARIKWNDDVLSTSKKDKDKHGYGLKNIKEQCEKYQGSMEINIENAIFQLILSFLKI